MAGGAKGVGLGSGSRGGGLEDLAGNGHGVENGDVLSDASYYFITDRDRKKWRMFNGKMHGGDVGRRAEGLEMGG